MKIKFEILGTSDRGGEGLLEDIKILNQNQYGVPVIKGKSIYTRIFIRRIK